MGKRLLLVLGSTLLALAIAEVAARVQLGDEFQQGAYVGPPQAMCGRFDAELGWANLEGASSRIAARGGTYRVTINSQGNRGPERAFEKPPEVVRVLVLGDSTAWGWGVDDAEVWTELVDARLGEEVEVINLAVPGYGTDQQLMQVERVGADWQPDIVLLAFVHNDLTSNPHPVYNGMNKPVLARDETGAWVWTHQPVVPPATDSQLDDRQALRGAGKYLALAKLLEPPRPGHVRVNREDPAIVAAVNRYWDRLLDPDRVTHELLGRLRLACDELDAELLAFVIPHLHDRYLYEPATPLPASVAERDVATPFETHGTQQLAAAGRLLGFQTFSIDQALLDVVTTGTNLDCGDEHLNARGNEIVADVVARALEPALLRAR